MSGRWCAVALLQAGNRDATHAERACCIVEGSPVKPTMGFYSEGFPVKPVTAMAFSGKSRDGILRRGSGHILR
jgi:hypothetical protein